MTKKEAKIIAYRKLTALINDAVQTDIALEYGENEDKILAELKQIEKSLYKKALKLGGDYNQFSGK